MIVADVRLHDIMDRLAVVPRNHQDINALSRVLREKVQGISIKRSSDGLSVIASESPLLLSGCDGVDLRWISEALQFAQNRKRAQEVFPAIRAKVEEVKQNGRSFAEALLADIKGLDVLDDHQLVNVAAMTLPNSFGLCVFDEQGAGKTVTFIFAFDTLVSRDQVDFALIVAPKSMVAEWPRDFIKFKRDLYRVGVISGNRQEKLKQISSGADVLVTNFETAVSMEDELRALLRCCQGRACLAIDESFFIKNLDAKRTKSLLRLREWCNKAFVLCGTPAPNAPYDLVQQFNLVDFGMTFSGIDIPEDRDAARPIVQSAIEEKGIFVRHLKKDVLPSLPEKHFNRVLLELQPEQTKIYRSALQGLIEDLQNTNDEQFSRQIPSFLAKRSALLQICSNPISILPSYNETPIKLLALDSLLKELICKKGEKVVLWSFYTTSISAIMERYSSYLPVRYDGTISEVEERREAVRKFQEDSRTMLFVANPAAAGAGLTLHKSHIAIYESMSNQAAHYLQSLDRIHRRGQKSEVEYLILLCDNTLEIQEYDRLMQKERSAQELLGDSVATSLTRDIMLAETICAMRKLERH